MTLSAPCSEETWWLLDGQGSEGGSRATTVNGVGVTYDAFGRMVEQNRSGSYTEIDYAPTGAKLQLLNGQNAVTDFVPLPGGATAVYTARAGGLAYYRHSDWLGSSRLASTPSRTALRLLPSVLCSPPPPSTLCLPPSAF